MAENQNNLNEWRVEMARDYIQFSLDEAEGKPTEDQLAIFARLAPELMDMTWETGEGYIANRGLTK